MTPKQSSSNSPAERAGSDASELGDLLEVEAALARAKAQLGRIPGPVATAIAEQCRPELYDFAQLTEAAEEHATIVVPLVAAIRARLPEECRAAVHTPATSQDLIDSALMLAAARAVAALDAQLNRCENALLTLDNAYGDAPQMARTLLQPALPTTFGNLLGSWLAGLDDASLRLTRVHRESLAVQLAGPVGDLDDPELVDAFAAGLGLAAPARPWHTTRTRIVDLATALGLAVGVLGKIATDVILLSQAEIGELTEGAAGRSSSMPDKRNPARAVQLAALAARTPGLVATVFAVLPQELHRAAGGWQAENAAVRELLAIAGQAGRHAEAMLMGLEVHTDRMKANLR